MRSVMENAVEDKSVAFALRVIVDAPQYNSIQADCAELLKLLSAITKTMRNEK